MTLHLKNISLYKDDTKKDLLFESEDFVLSSGKLNVIYGQSGTGKTTLLNAICGMNHSYTGEMFLDDKLLTSNNINFKDDFSYVTSDQCYIEELSIIDQLRLVCSDENKIDEILNSLNLKEVSKKKAMKCSTGEQVRTSIATALLKNTKVLILDEPTANLDKINKKVVFDLLNEYSKSHLVIVSTHDVEYITEDYDTYKIENNKLICEQKGKANIIEYENKSTKNTKNNILISLKLGLKNSFKHKITFIFSFIFFCLFLISMFVMVSFGMIDEHRTKVAAINSTLNSSEMYYPFTTKEVVKELDDVACYTTRGTLKLKGTTDATTNTVNIICLEDLNEEAQNTYKSYFENFNYENSYTYPIVISSFGCDTRTDIATLYNVGDDFDLSLYNGLNGVGGGGFEEYRISPKFKVVGIISSDKHDVFYNAPCIIRRTDYISYLRTFGIRTMTISNSIVILLSKYKEYCDSNSGVLDKNEIFDDEEIYILDYFGTVLVSYSNIKDRLIKYNAGFTTQTEGNLYYVGNLPEKLNWMMLPFGYSTQKKFANCFIYDSDFNDWKNKSFFEQYLNGETLEYPISDNQTFEYLNVMDINSFVFSGAFWWGNNYDYEKFVIVSDELYGKLIDSIEKGNKEGANNRLDSLIIKEHTFYADKEYVKNHIDDIANAKYDNIEQNVVNSVSISKLNDCNRSLYNITCIKSVIVIFTIILCVLSLLISFVYIINTLKSLTHSFAVSQLLGKDKKWRLLLFLYSLLPIVLLSMITALSTSKLLTILFIKFMFRVGMYSFANFSFISLLSIPYYLAYILQFVALIGFVVFAMSISFIRRKKSAFRKIKENE